MQIREFQDQRSHRVKDFLHFVFRTILKKNCIIHCLWNVKAIVFCWRNHCKEMCHESFMWFWQIWQTINVTKNLLGSTWVSLGGLVKRNKSIKTKYVLSYHYSYFMTGLNWRRWKSTKSNLQNLKINIYIYLHCIHRISEQFNPPTLGISFNWDQQEAANRKVGITSLLAPPSFFF